MTLAFIRRTSFTFGLALAANATTVDLADVVQVSVGGAHACVVTTAGGIKCWGENSSGELGDGTFTNRPVAGDVPGLSSGHIAVASSKHSYGGTGGGHNCALSAAGGVKCWGRNESGQLGNPLASGASSVPIDVFGLSSGIAAISAGGKHTCALTDGGAVKCWGDNQSGQLGDGTNDNRDVPTDVTGLASGVVQIEAGLEQTCALTAAGAVKCWGSNIFGSLGDGTTISRNIPVDVLSLSSGVASVTVGGVMAFNTIPQGAGHSCVVMTSGGAKCWGRNTNGQLGDGSQSDSLSPIDVAGLTAGVAVVSAGGFSSSVFNTMAFSPSGRTCALTVGGAVKCWGRVAASGNFSLVATDVPGLSSGITNISVGGAFNCALTVAGTVRCWGPFRYGEIPQAIPSGTTAQTIAVGFNSPVAIGATAPLSATSSSGYPVAYTSLTPAICSVSGANVTGLASGMCVIAADQAGNSNYDPAPRVTFQFRIGDPVAQSITWGPAPDVAVGGIGGVSATASSGLPVSFGSNTPSVCAVSGSTVRGVGPGSCTLRASQSGDELYGPAPQSTLTFAVTMGPARLGNISTRMQVLGGDDVLIGGFVIGGSADKTVILRARGPSLAPFGIANALANPMLQLVRSSDQSTLATNDDWGTAANAGAIAESGFAPGNALEAAILVTLSPGAYTGIVSGAGGVTGVGIFEVFELDHPEAPLVNISSRGRVLTGNDVMIGGFVIQGDGPQAVVVRARGPSLAPFGITEPLADPSLSLFEGQNFVLSNDDWGNAPNAAQIQASGFAPSDPRECAILITLNPGAYTAIVTGAGNGTGVGIVEVFKQ